MTEENTPFLESNPNRQLSSQQFSRGETPVIFETQDRAKADNPLSQKRQNQAESKVIYRGREERSRSGTGEVQPHPIDCPQVLVQH